MCPALTSVCATQDLVELQMVYGLFNGNGVGSYGSLIFHLLDQGLLNIADTCDVRSKRKTLSARRTEAPPVAESVHDICTCGKDDSSSGT